MKPNRNYETVLLPDNNTVTISVEQGYYIDFIAFCCSRGDGYGCTEPKLLLNGTESTTAVCWELKDLRNQQNSSHEWYRWLMISVKECPSTPDPTTGTLTITKNIKGLPFNQIPVTSFDFAVTPPSGTPETKLFTLNVAETNNVITATNFKELDVGNYLLIESYYAGPEGLEVAGYTLVTMISVNGSDPVKFVEYEEKFGDIKIEAGKNTTVVLTDTYTPIGNDENNHATISIKKYETGNENKPLAGAKFKLEKLAGTNWVAYGSVGTTDANGALVYTIMHAGDYKLTEIEAPAGYKLGNKSEWTFTVVKSSSTKTVGNKIVNVHDYKITKVGEQTIAAENQVTTHLFEIENTKIPTVAVAIQKVVKVTGNTAPGSVVFTFGAKYQDTNKNWVELACANNTITTNGAGTYTRNDMTITLPDTIPAGGLEIVIYEKNDGRANWTYSKDTYKLHVLAAGTIEAVPATNSTSATLPSVPVYSFENTYSYTYTPPARPSDPIRRQPTTTTTKPVKSVKTGDMGIALYAVTSLLSLSGTALLIKKRKDEK